MQNWDSMPTAANYVEHNNWYNNMFAANIKTEPGSSSPTNQTEHDSPSTSSAAANSQMENYLKQQQFSPVDANMTALSPSPSNNHNNASSHNGQQQQFYDATGLHQQLMQQQQYQHQFQQAQHAAAQNQVTSHLPLGFNPLTPPGLPQAVLPAISHLYGQSAQLQRNQQQTPSPHTQTMLENSEKSTLTPRHTPPMDITPPKSPKVANPVATNDHQQDQELISNSSEDNLKCTVDSDEDENIRLPIYNSHGKMKNYKCKSCGVVAITKLTFWEHARIHMKPEKILQCSKCPFVTELKHHLEYHIRKHKNIKPFLCDKCSYTCVNKSMLNSHRKSHSSVYQYRCVDCDYATKYCHSFKLHLRKYDHKPGMILDEEGVPNPSVIIDVYGSRRGPKNKGSSGGSSKKSNTDLKTPATSQLSAALQGFPINTQNPMPASPAKSTASVSSDQPALTLNMSLHQQQQSVVPQMSPPPQATVPGQNGSIPLLHPFATLLQQNSNPPFFSYWNLNMHVLAAQQQAAVLAQLSPRMREQLQKYQQEQSNQQPHMRDLNNVDEDEGEEEDDQAIVRQPVDSAMDLSQGTPTKDEKQQQQHTPPDAAINLKLPEDNTETPVFSSSTASRRKGRVLKLEIEQSKANQSISDPASPQIVNTSEMPAASSPIAYQAPPNKIDDQSSADESMETGQPHIQNNPSNTSATSTASSSGNSSNSSTTASSSANSAANSSPTATPAMYECKYCDIFFKDAVLYTIHMGYHSCDDVFKCNMCGEKCDGPVGLFVHMARNAHS